MAETSVVTLFVRLALSLGVVIGLMLLAARVMRNRGVTTARGTRRSPGIELELLARRSLGKNTSITVVRAAGRAMVLGVTDHMITLLGDADVAEEPLEAQGTALPQGLGPTPTRKAPLDALREKTLRRV